MSRKAGTNYYKKSLLAFMKPNGANINAYTYICTYIYICTYKRNIQIFNYLIKNRMRLISFIRRKQGPLTESKIEQFQQDVLQLTNRDRRSRNLGTIRRNDILSKWAQDHTQDQIIMGDSAHTGSYGSNLTHRLRRINYDYHLPSENVAYAHLDDAQMMWSLMNSTALPCQ